MNTNPIEEFRNNFFKKLEDEKIQKEREIKLQQKNCWHKYTKFIKYTEKVNITVCEKCNHAKWC